MEYIKEVNMNEDIEVFKELNQFVLEGKDYEQYIESIFLNKLISQEILIEFYKFNISIYRFQSALYALSHIDKSLLDKLPMPDIISYLLEDEEWLLGILNILINDVTVVGIQDQELEDIKRAIEDLEHSKFKRLFDVVSSELMRRS